MTPKFSRHSSVSYLRNASLRTRLLAGAAGLALVAGGSAAKAGDAKWQPWLDFGGKVGDDRSLGAVELFVPVWQDNDSLLFGSFRGQMDDDDADEFNVGLGFRDMINPEWIMGVYGYYDHKNSEWDNDFDQFSAGLEFLSEDWDFRVNGYLADDSLEAVPVLSHVDITGTTIQIFHGVEGALSGFDGEAGYRLMSGQNFETRLFIGGFVYDGHDGLEDVSGPRGRIEARIFDLDFLGPQSRLTLEAEVQDDDIRDTTAFFGVSLRVPLSFSGEAPSLAGLDRRMVDSVQKDLDIVTVVSTDLDTFAEDVIISTDLGSSNVTDTLIYIDDTGGGPGTYKDPASFTQGTFTGGGVDAVFIALAKTGDIDNAGDYNVDLLTGQVILGGGTTVTITGADSGDVFAFTFQGAPGTFYGVSAADNILELADDNWIENVGFDGKFDNAIYGYNVTGFDINRNDFDGSAGGITAIEIQNYGSHDVTGEIEENYFYATDNDALRFDHYASNGGAAAIDLFINNNEFRNIYFNPIDLEVYVDDPGTTATVDFDVTNNLLDTNVFGAGIFIGFGATDGATIFADSTVNITGNDIYDAYYYGIYVNAFYNSTGGEVYLNLNITDNYIYGGARGGVILRVGAFDDAYAGVTADISDNEIVDVAEDGIVVSTVTDGKAGYKDAYIYFYGTIENNLIDSPGSDGVLVYNYADYYTDQSIAVYVDDNSIYDAGDDGIEISSNAYNDAYIDPHGTISGNFIDTPASTGILISSYADDGANIYQDFALDGDTILSAGGDGIYVESRAYDFAEIYVYLDIADAYIYDSSDAGIELYNYLDDSGYVREDVTLDDSLILFAGDTGVGIYNLVYDSADVVQNIEISYTDILGAYLDGIYLGANVDDYATVDTYLSFTGSYFDTAVIDGTFSGVGGDHHGIDAQGYVENGGDIYFDIYVSYAEIRYWDNHGISVYQTADDDVTANDSYARLDLTVNESYIHDNGDYGIWVDAYAYGYTGDSAVYQYVNVYDSAIKYNSGGIGLYQMAKGPLADTYQDLYVDPTVIANNTFNGIYAGIFSTYSNALGYAFATLNIDVRESGIFDNGDSGIFVTGYSDEGSSSYASLYVYDSYIGSNTDYGIYVDLAAYDYGVTKTESDTNLYLEVSDSFIGYNGASGIGVFFYADAGGDMVFDAEIYDTLVIDNGGYKQAGFEAYLLATSTNGSDSSSIYSYVDIAGSVFSESHYGAHITTYAYDYAFNDLEVRISESTFGKYYGYYVYGGNFIGLGIEVGQYSDNAAYTSTTYVDIADSDFSSNADAGAVLAFKGGKGTSYDYSYLLSDVYINDSTFDSNGVAGLIVALYSASSVDAYPDADLDLYIEDSSFDKNGAGIVFAASVYYSDYVEFDAEINDTSISGNTYTGLAGYFSSSGDNDELDVEIGLYGVTVDGNGSGGTTDGGLVVEVSAYDKSYIDFDIYMGTGYLGARNSFSGNDGSGIAVVGYVPDKYASINADVDIDSADIEGNTYFGALVAMDAENYGYIQSGVEVDDSVFDKNAGAGLLVYNLADDYGSIDSNLDIADSSFTNTYTSSGFFATYYPQFDGSGLVVVNIAEDFGYVNSDVYIDPSYFADNAQSGAAFVNYADDYGDIYQTLGIYDSEFTGNGFAGLHVYNYANDFGQIYVYGEIGNSTDGGNYFAGNDYGVITESVVNDYGEAYFGTSGSYFYFGYNEFTDNGTGILISNEDVDGIGTLSQPNSYVYFYENNSHGNSKAGFAFENGGYDANMYIRGDENTSEFNFFGFSLFNSSCANVLDVSLTDTDYLPNTVPIFSTDTCGTTTYSITP